MRDAVILAVLGMGTVLILLFVINLMIVAIGKLFGPKETKKIENPKQGGAVSSPAAAAPVTPAASYKDEAIVACKTLLAGGGEERQTGRAHGARRFFQLYRSRGGRALAACVGGGQHGDLACRRRVWRADAVFPGIYRFGAGRVCTQRISAGRFVAAAEPADHGFDRPDVALCAKSA